MDAKRNTAIRDKHRAILSRDNPDCAICGLPIDLTLPHLDPYEFVVDHIVALARGGPDVLSNKQPAHRTCNRTKGDKEFAPIIKRSGALKR